MGQIGKKQINNKRMSVICKISPSRAGQIKILYIKKYICYNSIQIEKQTYCADHVSAFHKYALSMFSF